MPWAAESSGPARAAAGRDEGSFARRDPRLATLALLGALNWTVKWYREGGGKGAAQVGEEFADLFLSGLESRSRE